MAATMSHRLARSKESSGKCDSIKALGGRPQASADAEKARPDQAATMNNGRPDTSEVLRWRSMVSTDEQIQEDRIVMSRSPL
jgi:hypothetical protein